MRTRSYRWWLARGLDSLLFVPALLYVLSEQVLWSGARTLLRGLGGLSAVRAAHVWLGLLPPWAALPVFLVPDLFSHASEFWAALLFARGHLFAATLAAVLGKGLATVILVWIYQACEPALLRVRWFAHLHDAALALRERILARTGPWRDAATRRLLALGGGSGIIRSRFLRWRLRLASRVATLRIRL
ncbi:MAG: hypothetical protein KGI51_12655 [Rhodospirillales bacterium]|nr:hypothetical protein [Rhodospirillales bacterium]